MVAKGNSALRSLRFVLGEFHFYRHQAGNGITSAEYALVKEQYPIEHSRRNDDLRCRHHTPIRPAHEGLWRQMGILPCGRFALSSENSISLAAKPE